MAKNARMTLRLKATGEIRIVCPPIAAGSKRHASAPTLDKKLKIQDGLLRGDDSICIETRKTKFTRRAKETLKEAGAVMDARFGKKQLLCTWTLPGHGATAFRAVARLAPYITNRVCQWLRDNVPNVWYAWVFEWQKRGALHQHILIGSDDHAALAKVYIQWHSVVRSILEQAGRKIGVDLFWNEVTGRCNRDVAHNGQDAEFVRKSAARYLAKYMGKSCRRFDGRDFHCPPTWWRVSTGALRAIYQERDFITLEAPQPRLLDAAVDSQSALLRQGGADCWKYRNAALPWLQNVVVWADSRAHGVALWDLLKSEVTRLLGEGWKIYLSPQVVSRSTAEVVAPVEVVASFWEVAREFAFVRALPAPTQ